MTVRKQFGQNYRKSTGSYQSDKTCGEKLCALRHIDYTSKCAIFNEYAQIAHSAWVSQSLVHVTWYAVQ
jgi:hypothetical protein